MVKFISICNDAMIYYFGWIDIRFDTESQNNSSGRPGGIHEIKTVIAEYERYIQLCLLKSFNGMDTLTISAFHNHDNSYSDEILALYQKIGELSPESYGLLFVRFPEDVNRNNEFFVYRLAKGSLTKHKDNLLSPCDMIIGN